MNGFVKEARAKIDAAKEMETGKVQMKKADFDKLVFNIGRDKRMCLGDYCPEYPVCSDCWKEALLNYIEII